MKKYLIYILNSLSFLLEKRFINIYKLEKRYICSSYSFNRSLTNFVCFSKVIYPLDTISAIFIILLNFLSLVLLNSSLYLSKFLIFDTFVLHSDNSMKNLTIYSVSDTICFIYNQFIIYYYKF